MNITEDEDGISYSFRTVFEKIVSVPETTTQEIVDPPIPEIQLIDEAAQECKFLISSVGMFI